jgi:membrane-associated PAP2 superfamily phosphatase
MQFPLVTSGERPAATPPADGRRFWLLHLWLPLAVFVPLAVVFALSDLDRQISLAWAYDVSTGSFPARHAWWAERLLHGYGRDLIWLVVLTCLGLLGVSRFRPALRSWRRPLCFVVVTIGLTTGFIGGLKQVTRVNCPWDLQGFGGTQKYVPVFGARSAETKPGACFPAAHAGSGFALFALYFALRDRRRRWALVALWATMAIGVAFSVGQEARGAHFVSHDLWSAFLAWFCCLALYTGMQPNRLLILRKAPETRDAASKAVGRGEADALRLV